MWTHTSWGGKASIALWLLMSCLPLQQTHRHFHPLCLTQCLPQCRAQLAHQHQSLRQGQSNTLLCPLSAECDWYFDSGSTVYVNVFFFCVIIMWHIWYDTPFVKVHKHLRALGRLMKQTEQQGKHVPCVYPSNKNDSNPHWYGRIKSNSKWNTHLKKVIKQM